MDNGRRRESLPVDDWSAAGMAAGLRRMAKMRANETGTIEE